MSRPHADQFSPVELPRYDGGQYYGHQDQSFNPYRTDYQQAAPYQPQPPQQQRPYLPAAHSAQQSIDYGSAPNAYPPLNSQETITMAEKETWATKKYRTAFGDWAFKDLLAVKFIKYWIILIVLIVGISLVTLYHHQIVAWLRPKAEELQDLPAGWLIIVGVLFVISFPPLFGHEIVAVLCGLIYGLWIGFGIVALGSFLGELGNWFLFRYCLRNKAKKKELTDVTYASMARVINEGGFKVVLYARLSAIPGHLTTPLFAVSDMTLWIFVISAILSTPKQLLPVYLGTIFDDEENGTRSTASKIVQWVIVGFGGLVTIWTCVYIYRKLLKVRPLIEAEFAMRKAEGIMAETGKPAATPNSVYPQRRSNGFARLSSGRDDPSSSAVDLSDLPPVLPYTEQPYARPQAERSHTERQHLAPYADPYAQDSMQNLDEPRSASRAQSPAPTYDSHAPTYISHAPTYETHAPRPVNYSRPARDTRYA